MVVLSSMHEDEVAVVDLILLGLVVSLVLFLFCAGVLGVPYGIYRAWRSRRLMLVFLISVPSAILAFFMMAPLAFLIGGGQG